MKALNWVTNCHVLSALCAAPILLSCTFASAEEATTPATGATPAAVVAPAAEAPVSPWSFNLTFATQYVTRGFSNSLGGPVVQGGVDYTHPSGFNAGFWMSTLSNEFVQGSWAETDYYAGYTKSFGDLNIGAQIYYYIYPNGKFVYDGSVPRQSYNYGELVPTLSYKWFSAKYWYTYTKDYFGVNDATMFTTGRGHSRGSGYLDLNANIPLTNGFTLQAHYGYQNVENFERINWSDGKIGITKSFDNGWSASVAATKVWTRTTDNIYGAGYKYDWTKYTVNGVNTYNPIRDTITVSVTKAF